MIKKFTQSPFSGASLLLNRWLLAFALPLLAAQAMQAQIYTASICSSPYVQAQGQAGTTFIGAGDDATFTNLNLPFPFQFYSTTYTQFLVNTNGHFVFLPGAARGFGNANLPTGTAGAALYPHWDDLDADVLVTPTCGIYSRVDGTAPNRIFTVEWYRIGHFNHDAQGGDITFQIQLHENGNRIFYKYQDVVFAGTQAANSNGASATVGLEGAVATPRPFSLFSFNTASLTTVTCIEWLKVSCDPVLAQQTVTVSVGANNCVADATLAVPTFNPAGCADGITIGLRYSVNGGPFTIVPLPGTTSVTIPGLPQGNHTVVWQTYLISNNQPMGGATQTITVIDGIPPVITCPANTTFNLSPGACSQIVSYDVTATDNCPGPTVSLNQNLTWPTPVDIALV